MFQVMCKVSGGYTGTRTAVLKANGVERWFDTRVEAEIEAMRLNREMNGNPYRTADFQYWVIER
jgi:hypothetical protein